ncbi:cyclopropane-fatty-acyl-phospholipid synthase [Phakopsora pachyrhizi]|nr:cyclopropane-fatty-acyl-phospholipid synthase [Phakopsora pachyrhizi]
MFKDQYLKTKNYSQTSTLALIDRFIESFKERFIDNGYGPLVLIARMTVLSLLNRIVRGQLIITTRDQRYVLGDPSINRSHERLEAEIRVLNDSFWIRMFLSSDLGFAEAYMVRDIEVDNLNSLFKLFILNRSNLSEMSMITSSIFSTINSIINSRFINSISNSISNISAHYDISNEMFRCFLSSDMTYSCAYFTDQLGGIDGDLSSSKEISKRKMIRRRRGQEEEKNQKQEVDDGRGSFKFVEDELEAAQLEKLDLIIDKAKISKGDRVLEIGSGWGSLAIRLVQRIGCKVDSITLSIEQRSLALERIKDLGLQDSIEIHLLDYRDLPNSFNGAFDRLISIEMIEAVGLEFLETYFGVVDRCLKPDGGLAVFQVITIPESRFDRYKSEVDFIKKWIFPGGVLPSVTFLMNCINRGSNKKLIIENVENIGPHYARTLREWQRRFEENFETRIKPDLIKTYYSTKPSSKKMTRAMKDEERIRDEVMIFKRKWIYYFEYCSSGFSSRVLGDHIFTITREGNPSI